MTGIVRAGNWLRQIKVQHLRQQYLGAETITFLLLWIVLWVTGRSSLLRDPGMFWHIAQGNLLLESGEFLQTDPFTITRTGEPWHSLQWLGEVPLALLYRWGGWDLLLWATVTLLAGLYTWIFARLHRSGLPPMLAGFVVAVVLAASTHHFHVRPHLASMVGMALIFGLLIDIDARRRGLVQLAWTVPLLVLWTNTHGGALGGWGTVVIAAVGWIAAWYFGGRSPIRSPRGMLGVAAVACLGGAALLVNPYGFDTVRQWLEILTMQLPDMIQEHRRPSVTDGATWMMLMLAGAYLAAMWKVWPSWRIAWLLPAPWLLLALTRVRHIPLFALLAALALADILAQSDWLANWRAAQVSSPFRRCRWAVPLLLVGSVGLGCLTSGAQASGGRWARLDPQRWPVVLIPALRQTAHQAGTESAIYNDLDFGGFVAFYVPEAKTFVDDRCELFGDQFLREYLEVERGTHVGRFDAWNQQYHFAAALTRPHSPLANHLEQSADWRLVESSPAAMLFRAVPKVRHLPAR